jgi:uncharacterized protein (DUF433 family)
MGTTRADVARWAFTRDQVIELTGLSSRQLRYWQDTGFFAPSYAPGSNFYSFRDLVGLRTLAQLRAKKVPLQALRKFGQWLSRKHEAPWSSLKFYVDGRDFYAGDPETGAHVSGRTLGQIRMRFSMERIAAKMEQAARRSRVRSRESIGHVSRSRQVLRNAPVVAGTRIPTKLIWDMRQDGASVQQVLNAYPTLTRKDVAAAEEYERERRKAG